MNKKRKEAVRMGEVKLRQYKKGSYLADSTGLIIVKDLTKDQIIQIQDYFLRKKG